MEPLKIGDIISPDKSVWNPNTDHLYKVINLTDGTGGLPKCRRIALGGEFMADAPIDVDFLFRHVISTTTEPKKNILVLDLEKFGDIEIEELYLLVYQHKEHQKTIRDYVQSSDRAFVALEG